MTHDEAAAVLESLPELERVEVARLSSGDVLVVECPGLVSQEIATRIGDGLKLIWPHNQILVIDGGVRLKVVSEA